MQTNKVTVYTTLDGKKFYGAENKIMAERHDHDLKNDLESAKYDSAIGQIVIDDYPVFSGKYKDLDEYNILINEDPDLGEKWKTVKLVTLALPAISPAQRAVRWHFS